MSNQSEAQNYDPKPVYPICRNCMYYTSTFREVGAYKVMSQYVEESNRRCGLGGFTIELTATCDMHQFKTAKEKQPATPTRLKDTYYDR